MSWHFSLALEEAFSEACSSDGAPSAPWLLEQCVPRANGQWWITHALQLADTRKFPGSGAFTHEAWKAWFDALTPEQQQFLRDKSQWEHMSLPAVAREWGVEVHP